MTTLSIDVNDTRIATVSLAGMQVVDVSVRGALDCTSKATLSAMGGQHHLTTILSSGNSAAFELVR